MSGFWNKNNLACRKVWLYLKVMQQHNKVFKDAGKLKMKELQFWNDLSSPELREQQAKMMAHQFDNMFRSFDKAKYEEGSSLATAIDEMKTILTDENKTIANLAEIADNNYFFLGEELDDEI